MQEPQAGTNDSLLMDRIRNRDEDAMAALYQKYSRLVFTVGLRVLHDRAAAEDLTHDVFLNLWRQPVANVPASGMAPWLAVVARNRAIDLLRKRKFQTDPGEDAHVPEPSVLPDFDGQQMAHRARAAIAELGADQRQALELAYFEGLTHSEIAEKTGVPLGTIKTRIRTGLQLLRKEFQC